MTLSSIFFSDGNSLNLLLTTTLVRTTGSHMEQLDVLKKSIRNSLGSENPAYLQLRRGYWQVRNQALLLRKLWMRRNFDPSRIFLNLGGGLFMQPNWRVLDYCSEYYPLRSSLLDYNVNLEIEEKLPFDSNSVEVIYSSHCLEHLQRSITPRLFREIHRVLRPGGWLRLTVPDSDMAYFAYLRGDYDFFGIEGPSSPPLAQAFLGFFSAGPFDKGATEQLNQDIQTLTKTEFLDRYCPATVDRNTIDYSHHVNWFNAEKVRSLAISAGFEDSRIWKSGYKQSQSPMLRGPGFDENIPHCSLYMEMEKCGDDSH